jgi:hypothetical protein
MTTYAVVLAVSAGLTFSAMAAATTSPRESHSTIALVQQSAYIDTIPESQAGTEIILMRRIQMSVTSSYPTVAQNTGYPLSMRIASTVVVLVTIFGALIGYIYPGPFIGTLFPLGVTLWWILYRIILRHDARVSAHS